MSDDVLEALDLSPEQFRTEGGAINRTKLRAAILRPDEYLPKGHWLREADLPSQTRFWVAAAAAAARLVQGTGDAQQFCNAVDRLCAAVQGEQPAWPICGVRGDGETVVISVKGGNDAARWLCGELLRQMEAR